MKDTIPLSQVVLGRRLLGVFMTIYMPTILMNVVGHCTMYFKPFFFEAQVWDILERNKRWKLIHVIFCLFRCRSILLLCLCSLQCLSGEAQIFSLKKVSKSSRPSMSIILFAQRKQWPTTNKLPEDGRYLADLQPLYTFLRSPAPHLQGKL